MGLEDFKDYDNVRKRKERVIEMKQKLTIGEFAKLRGTTTETLRHYDRIGLLKPIEIDEETGYRYYSVLQYEELGTIKELRQLGMSLEEIKQYFDNRNLNQSINLLKKRQEQLQQTIKELQALEQSIGEKLQYFEEMEKEPLLETLSLKYFKERDMITVEKQLTTEVEIGYECVNLENQLKEIAPIVGSNRIGTIIHGDRAQGMSLFIFIKDKEGIDSRFIKKIKAGTYACMYYRGSEWDVYRHIQEMIPKLTEKGYTIDGEIIQVVQIDVSVTDQIDEKMTEIQIPVK